MDFPTRIKQHKNESDSFAIILYKLREIGIFRNVTESDYGIDFEIEVVNVDKVQGHCIKVQVKSSENLTIRQKDGVATVGGIEQSSLNYWAEISYNTPVVAIAVDVVNENIYVSDPLFWQAIKRLDNTSKTKTIEFGTCHNDKVNVEKLRNIAYGYGLRDLIYAHKWIMRNIRHIFEMYTDASWYDMGCSNIDMNLFRSLLENVKVFLSFNESFKTKESDFNTLFDFNVYKRLNDYEDDLTNIVVKQALTPVLLPLADTLNEYRTHILESAYYWLEKDPEYLRLTYNTKWPSFTKVEELEQYDYEKLYGWQFNPDHDFYQFLSDLANQACLSDFHFIKYYSC